MLMVLIFLYGMAILLAYGEIYNRSMGYPISWLVHLSPPIILLMGPALWFYIKSLTMQKFRFQAEYLLHFLPFLFVFAMFYFSIWQLPVEERVAIEQSKSFRYTYIFPVSVFLIAASTQGYYWWGWWMIKKYKQRLSQYFSSIQKFDLKWMSFLLIAAIVFHAGISLLYILDYFLNLMPYDTLQIIGYSFASIFIFVIGFYGIKQGSVFTERSVRVNLDQKQEERLKLQNLSREEKVFVDYLIDFMKREKPYLNPEITLADLSQQLQKPADFLSGILNARLNKSFYDFINYYRIMEFKAQVLKADFTQFSILGVAFECGFNSKAAFYRAFRKNEGITPGAYISEVSQKNETPKMVK